MKKITFPGFLLLIYFLVFIWSAIKPVAMDVWIVEALTSLVPVILLWILYVKNIRFSNLAYFMMLFFPVMHIVGAHYTFSEVPFDWFNNLFGFERNMYDRVAHFSVGFYSLGVAEVLYAKNLVKNKFVAWSYALFLIMAVAAGYELFEWQYAVMSDPEAGIAVLGSQGDIWDAQKDMLMDTLGGVLGVILFYFTGKRKE